MGMFGILGAHLAGAIVRDDSRIGIKLAFVAPPLECRRIAQWKTEISSATSGLSRRRFSALSGRMIGILGAHNPICTCTDPVVGVFLFVEMWEFFGRNRAASGRGKRSD